MTEITSPHSVGTAKDNEALVSAFLSLAGELSLPLTRGNTKGKYDPLEVDRHPLKNALCVESDCTTFFGGDDLIKNLREAKFEVRPANIGQHTRYKVFGISPNSISTNKTLFESLVRSSVGYCLNPTAGSRMSNH